MKSSRVLVAGAMLGALASILAAQGPGAKSTIADDRNFKAHPAFQTQWADYLLTKKGKPCEIIFIGDSITEQWRWGPGKAVWEKHYADRALDFGEGSDQTQNTIWRLNNLPIGEFKPRVAVILIGTNNFNDSAEDIAAGVKAVIDTTKAKFAGIKVVVVSILPNARANDKTTAANALIAKLADDKDVFYLDLASKFTPEGDNWKGLDRGKLHLTATGYEMWAAELDPLLAKITR
jgi:lysophospholipase L1-like esterase